MDRTDGFRTQMSNAEHAQMGRKHIFAVNGSPQFLDLVRELFQDEHYNVTTTNYVPRTFDQVAALQPDLLLIDLVVHRQAGWELLEHLKVEALTFGIPVLVTSTDFRLLEQAEREASRYAGNQYFVMPFDLEEIVKAVRDLIGDA